MVDHLSLILNFSLTLPKYNTPTGNGDQNMACNCTTEDIVFSTTRTAEEVANNGFVNTTQATNLATLFLIWDTLIKQGIDRSNMAMNRSTSVGAVYKESTFPALEIVADTYNSIALIENFGSGDQIGQYRLRCSAEFQLSASDFVTIQLFRILNGTPTDISSGLTTQQKARARGNFSAGVHNLAFEYTPTQTFSGNNYQFELKIKSMSGNLLADVPIVGHIVPEKITTDTSQSYYPVPPPEGGGGSGGNSGGDI